MVAKRRELSSYNIFVQQVMPMLCALEKEKPKELRRHPSQLMKVIGEMWQVRKRGCIDISAEHFNLFVRLGSAVA
jgi:hypothetical protein